MFLQRQAEDSDVAECEEISKIRETRRREFRFYFVDLTAAAPKRRSEMKINEPLLKVVMASIEAEPKRMNGGHAAFVLNALSYNSEEGEFETKGGDSIEFFARQKLGLTEKQSDRLFYFKEWGYDEGWPQKFVTQYKKARSPKAKAAAAIARIQHFIETKGKE